MRLILAHLDPKRLRGEFSCRVGSLPEHKRRNAILSRCAWVHIGLYFEIQTHSTFLRSDPLSRSAAVPCLWSPARAQVKQSRNSAIPKLCNAVPKNTGVIST